MTLKYTFARALGAFAIAAFILSGCDTSSALFSEDEKSSIYTLSFAVSDATLSGAEVKAGESIKVSVAKMRGAAEAGRLSLSLASADGGALSGLDYVVGPAPRTASGGKELSVDQIVGSLPSFPLPSTLAPGSYRLVAQLSSVAGATLARSETVFFVAEEGFGLDSLSLYPPTSAPGEAVLLSASTRAKSGSASAKTAWLRWSSEGKVFAEGLLSGGFDKVVWRAPSLEGAYSLSAELFPSKPPVLSSLPASPWSRGISAIVAASAAASADEYADSSRLVSHFAFEGDFSDSGTRAQGVKPQSFGLPALEAYPGGFGYRFNGSSGLSAPGALPASSSFTLLARLYAEGDSGEILRFASSDGASVLRVGVEGRVPFAETRTPDGLVSRSSPKAEVPKGLVNLALSFAARGDAYELVWSVEGERFSSPGLPRVSFPAGAKCVLGGSQALEGVYDEIAISDDSQAGVPPLYAAASLRKYGAELYIASGFETSSLPAGAVSSGKLSFEPRSLGLDPGARLSFPTVLPTARALRVELDFAARQGGALALALSSQAALGGDEGGSLIRIDSGGAIRGPEGSLLGLLSPEKKGQLVFILKAYEGGFELASSSGLPVARFSAPSSSARLLLSIANQGSSGSVALNRLLARAAPESLSLAESPRYARLR
jgi:hypothetical protein